MCNISRIVVILCVIVHFAFCFVFSIPCVPVMKLELWSPSFKLSFVFECVCRLHIFVLDSHLETLWESNCPFGFLLVMFPLGSSYFVFVFLSL